MHLANHEIMRFCVVSTLKSDKCQLKVISNLNAHQQAELYVYN
jgi:hypothetical protein